MGKLLRILQLFAMIFILVSCGASEEEAASSGIVEQDPFKIGTISLAVTGSTTIAADSSSTTTLEATVLNSKSEPLSGKLILLSIPTDGGSVITNLVATDSSGIASFELTSSSVPGDYAYRVSSESRNSNYTTVTFSGEPIDSISLTVTGSASIDADGASTTTLEALVLDASANPLEGRSISLDIPTDGGASSAALTNASGVATFTLTSSLVIGTYTYFATAESVNSNTQDIDFVAPAVDSIILAVTGAASIAADGVATTTLEATVLDAGSNPLSGKSVVLNIPTDGGTTTSPATTDASGIATFTLTSSLVAGSYSYTATSESVNSNSESVTFNAPVATVNLAVTGATDISADGVATTTLEATVLDGMGSPLSGRSVTLNIPTDGGTTTNPATSDGSGVATFTLTSSLVVGTYSYTATSETINSTSQDVTFSNASVDSVTLAITGATSITADGISTTTLEATVLDASANPLSGRSVTLNIPTDGGTTTNPATTNASGVASFTLTSSLVEGTYSYTATSETINSTSQDVTFTPIPVDSVSLSVTGAFAIVGDGVTTTTLEATVLDASANPLSGRDVTLNIPVNGGTVSVNPVTTDGSGVASFTLTSSTTFGTYSYTATSESVNSNLDNVEFVAPVNSVSLAVIGSINIMADGVATTTLEATVYDASLNPLPSRDVTLNIPVNGGTVSTNPVTTNGSGVATFTLTSSTTAGLYSYTTTCESVNSASEDVTFIEPIGAVTLSVTGATTILADGTSTTTLEALVEDGSSNPLSGRDVTLNIPANGGTVSTNPVTTNGSGVASFTLTSSTTAGLYAYTATSESVNSNSQNVTFDNPIATITLSVTGATTIAADGTSTTTLEALVEDGSSNPLSGKDITLNIPANGGTTTNPATTNGSGIATFTLTSSTTAGVYSYTATGEAINSGSQNVTFAVPVATVTLTVTGSTTILADGVTTTTLEALVEDGSSNPLSGRDVTLNIPANGGTTTNPATTNGSGIATFTLTSSTTAGVYSYTATSEGVNSGSQNVTFQAPVGSVTLTVTGATSIAADGTSTTTLEALVEDGGSNPLSGRSVNLNIPANGGTTTNPATTNGSGIATFTLTSSTTAGVYSYTATSEGVNSVSQNVTFVAPVATVTLTVTGATSIAADGAQTTTLEALVEDGSSNPLSGRSVTLNIPTDGGTTTNPATTNGSGIATFTLTSSLVDGLYSYTATSEGVNSGSQNITFTVPNAVLEWDVTSYDYGSVNVAVTYTFTVTNTGTITSGSMAVTKTGAGSKWAIITDNCSGLTLAPAATCTVVFEYDGGRNPKGTQSGSLVIDATPGAAAVTVTTQGTTI